MLAGCSCSPGARRYGAFWLYMSSLRLRRGTGWIQMKKKCFLGVPEKVVWRGTLWRAFLTTPTALLLPTSGLFSIPPHQQGLCWQPSPLLGPQETFHACTLPGLLCLRPPLRICPAEVGDPQSMHFTQARAISAQTAVKEKMKETGFC